MKCLVVLAIASLAMVAHAQPVDHAHHGEAKQSSNSHVVVTINPEARVSAAINRSWSLLPPQCGSAMEIRVKVINQGFVTAPLRAAIVGNGRQYVALHMDEDKLSGHSEDNRVLSLVPSGPEPTDVTIAFSLDDNIGDAGGRDRVNLLIRCNRVKNLHEADAAERVEVRRCSRNARGLALFS